MRTRRQVPVRSRDTCTVGIVIINDEFELAILVIRDRLYSYVLPGVVRGVELIFEFANYITVIQCSNLRGRMREQTICTVCARIKLKVSIDLEFMSASE